MSDFDSFPLFWVHFSQKTAKFQFSKLLKYFNVLWCKKKWCQIWIFFIKKYEYFPLFGFPLVIKLRNFDYESHWNTVMFFYVKRNGVRFEYIPLKKVWFCFISIVWVHFSYKTEKFWFWKSLKYFNIFDKKDMTSDLKISHEKMPDFV